MGVSPMSNGNGSLLQSHGQDARSAAGRERLRGVTPAQALAHPTWDMGLMVTTNSATLVNKGLEVIEAHLLFDVPLDRIDVVVHPQSVVHSMVAVRRRLHHRPGLAAGHAPAHRPRDSAGRTACPGPPPRATGPRPPAGPSSRWTRWRSPPLAWPRTPRKQGSTYPAVFNAANEEAVMAFHAGRIRFTDIVDTIDAVLSEHSGSSELTVESVLDAEGWARTRAHERLAVSSL